MKTLSQRNAIQSLTPDQIAGYLTSQGWVNSGSLGKFASVWHREEESLQHLEIVEPLDRSLRDYENRVVDLIAVLSGFEGRPFLDVVSDVSRFYADVIKIRVAHDDVEGGSIPLNDGVLLFEKAKDLLVSAVRATFSKRRYFGGGKLPEDITDYIESMRLGQTEHGSYVVNMIAPIKLVDDGQGDDLKVSVSRAVSNTLAKSLTALDASVKAYKLSGDESTFDGAIQYGVSANLCDALVGLSGEAHSRNVRVTVSLSKAEEELEDLEREHDFEPSMIEYIQQASNYYKERYVIANKTVSGLVTKLSYDDGDDFGKVTIDALVNDIRKSVVFELPLDEYWQAHSAHKGSLIVECLGDLSVTPRSAVLTNATGFRVFGIDDMFSS